MVADSNLPYIRDTDVMLASYPRSGNTWCMNLLYYLEIPALEGYNHDLSSIDSADDIPDSPLGHLPGLDHFKATLKSTKLPFRIVKTHSLPQEAFRKSLYLYRDGRDVILSYYHYLRRFGHFNGDFHEFLEMPERPALKWAEHVTAWQNAADRLPIHYLRYEDLLANAETEVRKILDFLGEARPDFKIDFSVRNCQFSKLKQSEQTKVGFFNDSNLHFFRSGRSGGWKQTWNAEHLEIFMRDAKEALYTLGYK